MIPDGEFRDEGGPVRPRRPWWFTVLLVILVLPAFGLPWLLVSAPAESMLSTIIKLFPAYLLLSAVVAWYAYPQRKEVAWIIVSLMALSASGLYAI